MNIIHREDIKEEIKQIEGSNTDYVSINGNIYKNIKDDLFFEKSTHINKNNSYVYCGITFPEGNKSRRVHRLIAIAFIDNPNPNKFNVVGHKNNIKYDNRIENLYWTTVAENTQKAYDDQLAKNDKGIKDTQAIPIACYTNSHELISVYGSISEAGRCIEGFSKSSIAKVLDKTHHGIKGYYFVSISKEDYICSLCKKGLKFKTKYIKKTRKNFKAISPDGQEFFSDNQTEFAKTHDLKQANISQMLQKENGGIYKKWFFQAI